MKCILCGKDISAYKSFNNLYKCINCELIVDKNIYKENVNEKLEEEWFEESYDLTGSFWIDLFDKWNSKRTWNRLNKKIEVGANVLEIGVGSGYLLNFLRKKGLKVEGCDLSKRISLCLKEKYNINVFNCWIDQVEEKQKYDVVVMNHILEHVDNPVYFLREVLKRMKSGGVLHLVVPNAGSWNACFSSWINYVPYHLLYFNKKSLINVLKQVGFVDLRIETYEPFSGWFLTLLHTFLNKTKKHTNQIMYNSEKVKVGKRNSLKAHIYYSIMLVFGEVIYPLRFLQSKLGYGEELVILSRPVRD